MRSEAEIRSFIADLEFVLSLPGSVGEVEEGLLKTHALLLRWTLGEDNEATRARDKIRAGIEEAEPELSKNTKARVPKRREDLF